MWIAGKHRRKCVHPGGVSSGKDVAISNDSTWNTLVAMKRALRMQDDNVEPMHLSYMWLSM